MSPDENQSKRWMHGWMDVSEQNECMYACTITGLYDVCTCVECIKIKCKNGDMCRLVGRVG